MTATLIVAVIAAVPPTLAALLAFFGTRRSDRVAVEERAATFALSLENLQATVGRVESTVDRVEQGVVDLRGVVTDLKERVARLEGARLGTAG